MSQAAVQLDEAAELAEILDEAYYSPELFFRVVLGVEYLYPWQQRTCRKIEAKVREGRRQIKVLVRACHGAGKDFFSAGIVLWWMYTRDASGEKPRGLTLAPTWNGIEKLLWAEINALYFSPSSMLSGLAWGKMLGTELHLDKGVFALGLSTDKPGKLEGQHSRGAALRVIDEAKEIEKPWFEATDGLLNAPTSLDLWISTPAIEDGEFYHRDVGKDLEVLREKVSVDELIADYKAANADRQPGEPEQLKTLAGMEEWRRDRGRAWGETSPAFRSRALAEYIRDSSGKLFPTDLVEAALARVFEGSGTERAMGQDVAGSVDGDENATAVIEVLPPRVFKEGDDPDEPLSLRALDCWHEYDTSISRERGHVTASQFGCVQRIDTIGMGKGVYDEASSRGYSVEPYRASDSPRDEVQFINRKAEEAWTFRQKLERGAVSLAACPEHLVQKLKSQFAGMKYKIGAKGKIQVVDPSDSPDLVDAILIASAAPRVGITSTDVSWL